MTHLAARSPTPLLDDVHARLSATRVAAVVRPRGLEDLCALVRTARAADLAVSVSGGRHAMGGQPFARGALHVDARGLAHVLELDHEQGQLEVQAGAQWPAVLDALRRLQPRGRRWGLRQKQTGADRLTVAGAVSANAHGRVLGRPPFVADVEALTLVDAGGTPRRVDRRREPRLFAHAVGGYGLFGLLYSVRLRLAPLSVLRREVRDAEADEVVARLEQAAREGCPQGDFQFAVDPRDAGFLRRGVLSCYRPVEGARPDRAARLALGPQDWKELLRLAHTDKRAAFARYRAHYLASDGQLYDSDEVQSGFAVDGAHEALEREGRLPGGSEMISELYVPRARLADFLAAAARELRRRAADVVYGTVRLIEAERETALAWAREPWACVVLNLHLDHAPGPLARGRAAFRALIDLALERGGSYHLTYHRWARPAQLRAAHPGIDAFLAEKRRRDPEGRFQSEWYRHVARQVDPRAGGS